MKYDISPYDLQNARLKNLKQRDYLASNTFITSNGSVKSLIDVSMSANISTRYYAQLVNKVNTLQQVMTNEDLTPIFLTITLDGIYHDLLFGDYSRFELKHQKKLCENQINGTFQTKTSNREAFDVNDLYQVLRSQWASFQNSRVYRNMKKGNNVGYLFSVEPHESGVPHAHVLLYVPFKFIELLKEQFKKSFPALLNVTQDKTRLSAQQVENGEINGFQWTLSNPVGYIIKYCVKSFMDLKNQTEIDELQAWYIKNRIVRFTMSHTLVPQWVYNKVYPLESDWLYLSDLKLNAFCEWSQEDDYFKFEDIKNQKVLKYEKGLYQYFQDGILAHQFGETKEKEDFSMRFEAKPMLRKKLKKPISIKVFCNGIEYDLFQKPISQRGNYDLIDYYNHLNIETCNLQHFGLVQNECIRRNLINGEIQSINDFNTNIGA